MDFIEEYKKLQLSTPRIGAVRLKHVNSEYTYNIDECTDCSYGYDLRGCKNCFGCAGLRNKEFYIFNEQVSASDYQERVAAFSEDEILKKFEEIKLRTPRVYSIQLNSENFTGDYVYHSENAYECFDIYECQDVCHMLESKYLKDCCDVSVLEYGELCYNVSSNHRLNNSNCCYFCVSSSDLEYCELLFNCEYCFGCISLHHKKYCILNEQYSREEYFERVAEVKKELRAARQYGALWIPSTYPFEETVASWPSM